MPHEEQNNYHWLRLIWFDSKSCFVCWKCRNVMLLFLNIQYELPRQEPLCQDNFKGTCLTVILCILKYSYVRSRVLPATGLKNSHFIMRKQSENCLYPFLKHQHSKTENRMGLKNIFVSKRTAKNNIFHLNLALSSTFLHIAFSKEY